MISSEDLAFVCTLAGSRSLAAAARSLGVSAPSVSQRLTKLEKRLGIRLIERSGRAGLLLTSDCEFLVGEGRKLLRELEAVTTRLRRSKDEVAGHLRVVAPCGFGRYAGPAIGQMLDDHPQLTVELLLSDQTSKLPSAPWDVIIRVGQAMDSQLIGITLFHQPLRVCASPEYLRTRSAPMDPRDLQGHRCLSLADVGNVDLQWQFYAGDPEQQEVSIKVEPILFTNDGEVLRQWALAGLGIIRVPAWEVSDDLASGRLIPLLREYTAARIPVVALVSNRDLRAARVRTFIDYLKRTMAGNEDSEAGGRKHSLTAPANVPNCASNLLVFGNPKRQKTGF